MSSRSERVPVTIRFTAEEYDVLRALRSRYGGTDKTVMKFAFAMLAESTGKLETRVQESNLWDSKVSAMLPQLSSESEPTPE